MTATTATLIGVALTFLVGMLNYINHWRDRYWQRHQLWITDRFTKAVEHLGDGSQQVRIGAIFELERIAKDSAPDRLHIVSMLAAFVRQTLPAPAERKYEVIDVLIARAPDAQAALTVLCRPPLSLDRASSSEIGGLDLSRTDLRRSRLTEADIRHASLFASRLDGADLRHARLSDTNLASADFGRLAYDNPEFEKGADLRHADMTGTRGKDQARRLDEALQDPNGPTDTPFAGCPDCNPPDLSDPEARARHNTA